MMQTVGTSETSVNTYLTAWQYIPQNSKLHPRHRENLKSHVMSSQLIEVPLALEMMWDSSRGVQLQTSLDHHHTVECIHLCWTFWPSIYTVFYTQVNSVLNMFCYQNAKVLDIKSCMVTTMLEELMNNLYYVNET
jgi:hypothetical protein